jgi:hypothetical protein
MLLINVKQKCLNKKLSEFRWLCSLRCKKMIGLVINWSVWLKLYSKQDVNSVTALDTELRLGANLCSGGKATAHLKAIAHVSSNLLYIYLVTGGLFNANFSS